MSLFISSETPAVHAVSPGRCSDCVEYSLPMQIDTWSILGRGKSELEWDK
jgi:hypothetical protein